MASTPAKEESFLPCAQVGLTCIADNGANIFIALLSGLFFILRISSVVIYGAPDASSAFGISIRDQGNPLRAVTLVVLFSAAIWRLLSIKSAIRNASTMAFVVYSALALLSLASILWSDYPETSAKRLVPSLVTGVVALSCGVTLSPRKFILFIVACSAGSLCAEIVAEITYADIQLWDINYRMTGVFGPNNVAVISFIVMLSVLSWHMIEGRNLSVKRLVLFVIATCCMILAKSRMVTLMSIFLFPIFLAIVLGKGRIFIAASLIVISTCLGVLIVSGDIPVDFFDVASLGRDGDGKANVEGLSGRRDLWSLLAAYVEERPIGGYGFEAFWSPDRISRLSDLNNWSVMVAHSAHLEMALQLGLIGAALQGVLLIRAITKYRDSVARRGKVAAGHNLILLLFFAFVGITESVTILAGDIFAVILLSTIFNADTPAAVPTLADPRITELPCTLASSSSTHVDPDIPDDVPDG